MKNSKIIPKSQILPVKGLYYILKAENLFTLTKLDMFLLFPVDRLPAGFTPLVLPNPSRQRSQPIFLSASISSSAFIWEEKKCVCNVKQKVYCRPTW